MALLAASVEVKVIKPNPRDRPVSRSKITLAAIMKREGFTKVEFLEYSTVCHDTQINFEVRIFKGGTFHYSMHS